MPKRRKRESSWRWRPVVLGFSPAVQLKSVKPNMALDATSAGCLETLPSGTL